MRSLLIIILIGGVSASSSATIINIPADYPGIQQGIEASSDGDTVLVQPGRYVENINFKGRNITLGSLFLTTGDTSYISKTVIDGNYSDRVVAFTGGEDNRAMLVGFTITNGKAMLAAGVYCLSSSPVIAYNYILKNRAYY